MREMKVNNVNECGQATLGFAAVPWCNDPFLLSSDSARFNISGALIIGKDYATWGNRTFY